MSLLRRYALPSYSVLFALHCFHPLGSVAAPEVRTGFWRGQEITYTWVPGKDGSGKAFTRATFCSTALSSLRTALTAKASASVIRKYLWPKVGSVYQVPYIIDPASGDLTNLNTAITQFNSTFAGVIQFVALDGQTDYVDFNFDPQ